MRLSDGTIGKSYLVKQVDAAERITRRLEALGVNEGIFVRILNRKKTGTVMIKVRGTWLALGAKIADGIEVKEGEG
ncbi:FeoA family protein [Hominifimenecus sp. rT4P-3]|uniref:FeoA family protein n=1 Tax=Hominifimenecus sp. rT4P-3 TaxID=3242979 RepID=UPI003DA4F746